LPRGDGARVGRRGVRGAARVGTGRKDTVPAGVMQPSAWFLVYRCGISKCGVHSSLESLRMPHTGRHHRQEQRMKTPGQRMPRWSRLAACLVAGALVLFAASGAAAQASTGSVAGRVTDARSGLALGGTAVAILGT